MRSRKYQIDLATGLIEQVQIKRREKFEKELVEYKQYWKSFYEKVQPLGLPHDWVLTVLVVSGGISSFVSRKIPVLCAALCFSYIAFIEIVAAFYVGDGPQSKRPMIPVIKISKENLEGLSEYCSEEKKIELKKTLEDFDIDWNIDLDDLKILLNKISRQIDRNNSLAFLPPEFIDLKKLVSWYRPVVNEHHHNSSNQGSLRLSH